MGRLVTRTVRVGSKQKRATDWIQSGSVTSRTLLANATTILNQSFAFLEPATIVRTRGTLWISSDQVATTEQAFGAMGIAVFSD